MPFEQQRFLIASWREIWWERTGRRGLSRLQVRMDQDDPWRDWFDPIEGFTHELGFNYEIIVDVFPVNRGAVDGPSKLHRLSRLVRKTVARSVAVARAEGTIERFRPHRIRRYFQVC